MDGDSVLDENILLMGIGYRAIMACVVGDEGTLESMDSYISISRFNETITKRFITNEIYRKRER